MEESFIGLGRLRMQYQAIMLGHHRSSVRYMLASSECNHGRWRFHLVTVSKESWTTLMRPNGRPMTLQDDKAATPNENDGWMDRWMDDLGKDQPDTRISVPTFVRGPLFLALTHVTFSLVYPSTTVISR